MQRWIIGQSTAVVGAWRQQRDASADDRRTVIALVVVAVVSVLAVTASAGVAPLVVFTAAAVVALLAWHSTILSWSVIAGLLIAITLFVPVGRYALPVDLPFGLELYRVAVAVVLLFWLASLLVDPATALRSTPFDRSIAFIACAVIASVVVNPGRVAGLEGAVVKALTFFFSFVLVFYFLASVIRTDSAIRRLSGLIVGGGAVVGFFSIVEQRTDVNVFDHVGAIIPFLHFTGFGTVERAGLIRAYGSSSHPIELGVVLAMIAPIGLALTFGSARRWGIPTAVLVVGVLSTGSRTPFLALAASALVLLWLRPTDVRRIVPLVIPLIVVIKLVAPGSIATVKNAFFPSQGLLAEQSQLAPEADPLLAGGRVRLLAPMLREAAQTPLLGQGFATRQTGFDNPLRNAPILDNQWLGWLLQTGIVGFLSWLALFTVAARRLARFSRQQDGASGWLAAGFAASLTGYGVAMVFFDTYAFVQVTLLFWIITGLAASLLLSHPALVHSNSSETSAAHRPLHAGHVRPSVIV